MNALVTAAWLAISIAASDANPRVAPTVPPWPVELPAAAEVQGGVLLPDALAAEVHRRLVILDGYEAQCQATLDALDGLWRVDSEAAVARALAEQQAAQVAPWWQPYLLPAGAAAGFVAGFVLHSLLVR